MKANAIAKRKGATVVGIVLDDDEKAAKPSCMTFDEFILKITKILRRTSTSTSTSPSLIIINIMFTIIMIIVIVKATHGRGVPHEASEARPVNVLMGERRAIAPRQRRDERAACPRVNVLPCRGTLKSAVWLCVVTLAACPSSHGLRLAWR